MQPIAWYTFCPNSLVIATAPTPVTSILQIFFIKAGYVYKMPKIELESGVVLKENKEVVVCSAYGITYIAVLLISDDTEGSEIHLYTVSLEKAAVTRSHVLKVRNGHLVLADHFMCLFSS